MLWKGTSYEETMTVNQVVSKLRKLFPSVRFRVYRQKEVSPVSPESVSIHIMSENEDMLKDAWLAAKQYQKMDIMAREANFWVNPYFGDPFKGGKRLQISRPEIPAG